MLKDYMRIAPLEKGVVLFIFALLGYCLYIIWQSPSLLTMDYLPTFDTWWNFHHRLRSGELAQWNPYYLFGNIAVQWNFVPVTIFTPLLLILELTPEIFRNIHIAASLIVFISIYAMCRVLRYGRILSVFAFVCMLLTDWFMWILTNIVFIMPFMFFPISFGFLLSIAMDKKTELDYRYGLLAITLALSFTGSRLEYIIHETAFIAIFILIFTMYRFRRDRMASVRLFLTISSILIIALIANLWHINLTANSAMESGRVSAGLNLSRLFDPSIWIWVFITIAFQPYLIFMSLNIGLYRIIRRDRRINMLHMAVIVALEIAAIWVYVWARGRFGIHNEAMRALYNVDYGHIHLLFSRSSFLLLGAGLLFWFYEGEITLKETIRFLTAFFCGVYLIDQMNEIFVEGALNRLLFRINLTIAWISLFGVMAMFWKRDYRILTLFVTSILFGVSLKYFIYEMTGVIWLEYREFIFLMCPLIVLILEGVIFIGERLSGISTKWSVPLKLKYPASVLCALFMALLILYKIFAIILSSVQYMTFTPVNEAIIGLPKAYAAADAFRMAKPVSPWQRRFFPDEARGLYSYSRTMNVGKSFYSGEIPLYWWNIFDPERSPENYSRWHPAMNFVFLTYLRYAGHHFIIDYYRIVMLYPDTEKNRLYKEITALYGSGTRRAFITGNVVRFANYREEHSYLEERIKAGYPLSFEVTTSDPDFAEGAGNSTDLRYKLDFIKDYPEYIELKSVSNKDGYCALMDTFNKGWKAYIDGRETKIYRGYIGLRFIKLSLGSHRIEFRYSCPNLYALLVISILGWITIAGLNIYTSIGGGRHGDPKEPGVL